MAIKHIVGLSLIFLALSAYAGSPVLQINSAVPAPNYELTRDADDLAQLTDGQMLSFPVWSSRKSVGWAQRTPVILKGRVDAEKEALELRNLSIVTAKGAYAGVYPPARIDVYCRSNGEEWTHSGFLTTDSGSFPDRTSIRLEVPLTIPCVAELAIVLHAVDRFLMIDEIIPTTAPYQSAVAPPPDVTRKLATDEDLVRDSTARLRHQFQTWNEDQLATFAATMASRPHGQSHAAWLLPPWGQISVKSLLRANQIDNSTLDLAIPAGWPAQYVVGLLNGSGELRNYRIAIGGPVQPGIELFSIAPVITADGDQVYDPLLPISGDSVAVPARSVAYVLVRDTSIVRPKIMPISISSGTDWRADLKVRISSLEGITDWKSRAPDVGTWAYLSDAPIWRQDNRAHLLSFLRDSGVNVFVVHPESLPDPRKPDSWDVREKRLRDELRAYKGAGTVLLYLGWDDRLDSWRPGDAGLRSSVRTWVQRLVAVMTSEGYSYNDWALYPVDEPDDTGYRFLADVGSWIKVADKRVRIYANPGTVGVLDLIPGGPIYMLLDIVDIWQPLLGQPAELLGPILSRRADGEWWIYQVGKSPAKTILPNCYRKLAREASRRGATGFGFWSFSDTGGSSAWDDLDGTRADWAAVYEPTAESGIAPLVSSRRWEAFRQGIREYRALADCAIGGTADVDKAEACRLLEHAIDAELEGLECR